VLMSDWVVGVIGLGNMGGPAAARLATTHPTWGYDVSLERMNLAAKQGVRLTGEPTEIASRCDVLVLSLPMPADVVGFAEQVVGGHGRPGGVVVDLSTIDPGSARTAAEHCAGRGVDYLDAPVLGRPDRCGSWTLVVGGPQERVDEIRPLLEANVAARVVRAGDVGAGSVMKLMNNLMFGAINAVTAEVLNTCRLAGVDPDLFVRTVSDSGAAAVSNLFREIGPKMVSGDYSPTFAQALLEKDNRLAVQVAEDVGCPTWIGSAVSAVNQLALSDGLGDQDSAAVHQVYAARSRSGTQ
jgi:3-hydroxyisobutyrate dehydrogenase